MISVVFSEMVLGRLLRAVSIYIFLLYHLVTTISTTTRNHISYHDEEAQTRSEEATELITDHALEPAAPNSANGKPSPLSITASSRLSMLVNRVEPNEALVGVTRTLSNRKSSSAPITAKRHRRPDLRFDIVTPVLSSMPEDPESTGERPTTGISLTYYAMGEGSPAAMNLPTNRERSNSPTPDGQLRGEAYLQQTRASDSRSPDRPGFDTTFPEELTIEQEELGKSIARLGIPLVVAEHELSRETWSIPDSSLSPISDPTPSAKSRRQSTLRTDSLSLHSDFSLSVFPIPPPRPESVPTERTLSRPMGFRRKSQLITDNTTQRATLVQESPASTITIPSGANYDVTSFIDSRSTLVCR
jgi:hypothetical protein